MTLTLVGFYDTEYKMKEAITSSFPDWVFVKGHNYKGPKVVSSWDVRCRGCDGQKVGSKYRGFGFTVSSDPAWRREDGELPRPWIQQTHLDGCRDHIITCPNANAQPQTISLPGSTPVERLLRASSADVMNTGDLSQNPFNLPNNLDASFEEYFYPQPKRQKLIREPTVAAPPLPSPVLDNRDDRHFPQYQRLEPISQAILLLNTLLSSQSTTIPQQLVRNLEASLQATVPYLSSTPPQHQSFSAYLSPPQLSNSSSFNFLHLIQDSQQQLPVPQASLPTSQRFLSQTGVYTGSSLSSIQILPPTIDRLSSSSLSMHPIQPLHQAPENPAPFHQSNYPNDFH
jgi:hypothetical protein